jgi:hypothetical protein
MSVKTPQKISQPLTSIKLNSAALAGAISSSASIDAVMGDAEMGDATISSNMLLTTSAFNSPAYHELRENPHVELDGLQRLQENLAQLEDLHGRLRFMMRDLSGLIRRR